MFDELDIVEKIGNLLQGQPGLAGQIGWGLVAMLGLYKIFTSVGLGKMKWGEAGEKLEEMFKNFQWRFEGKEEGKGIDTIKAVGLDGSTVYSYGTGEFFLASKNSFSPITPLLSRREKKRLAKLRKQVVNQLNATYKANSTASISAQVEAFLNPVSMPDIRKLPVAKPVQTPVAAKPVEAPKPLSNYKEVVRPVAPAPKPVSVMVNKFQEAAKPAVAPAPKPVNVPVAPPVVAQKIEPQKIVVACPMCRTNRAIIVAGTAAPKCPECKTGKDKNIAPALLQTNADAKEFTGQNTGWTPAVSNGTVFKNYESTSGKFLAQPWYVAKTVGFEVRKQPSESFKDVALVEMYKQAKKNEKDAKKAAEKAVAAANKVVPANQIFAKDTQPVMAKVEAPKPVVAAPVVAPAPKIEEKKPEVKVVSDFFVYCCPKCRTTRALLSNKVADKSALVCKNDDCNGEKLVLTTANAEEFVLENGQKLTDYCKEKNLTSVRFRNYGSEKGDKFVAVILPMKNAPIHNGVKMTVKKQPSESIIGYVKKEKKEQPKPVAEKVVEANSMVTVEYKFANGAANAAKWDFKGFEGGQSWSNIREMMKGMKAGETRIIPACDDGKSHNSQFTVTVKAIV